MEEKTMYLGKANVRLIDIDKANILGLDESDPNAQDDIISNRITLTSRKEGII